MRQHCESILDKTRTKWEATGNWLLETDGYKLNKLENICSKWGCSAAVWDIAWLGIETRAGSGLSWKNEENFVKPWPFFAAKWKFFNLGNECKSSCKIFSFSKGTQAKPSRMSFIMRKNKSVFNQKTRNIYTTIVTARFNYFLTVWIHALTWTFILDFLMDCRGPSHKHELETY